MKRGHYAIIISAGLLSMSACSHDKSSNMGQGTPEIDVTEAIVKPVTIHKTYPGVLSSNQKVELVARVNGYLKSKPFESGSFIKKGTVLFTIEDGTYRDAVTRAQSAVESAKSNLDYAQTRYNAMAEALKSDAVSRMEVEQAKSTLEECKSNLSSSQAALQTARTQLGYCTVVAPFDGHITNSNYDVGAYLGGEGSPVVLATIYDDKYLVANFSIDDATALQAFRRNMEKGNVDYTRIPVKFSDETSHPYTADFSYLAPDVNTSTGTIRVQAKIDNADHELRSGMYCEVALPVEEESAAVLVRDASIGTDQLGKYVYLVNDSNRVVYTPVTVGETIDDTMRIVTKGIDGGDRYVTKALLKVRDGETVKPVNR